VEVPRELKRLRVDEGKPPITPEEAAEMWADAMPHGPFPSPQGYNQIAEILTFHLGYGIQDHIWPRKTAPVKDQLRRSRKVLFDYLQPIEKARNSFPPDGLSNRTGKAWKGKPASEIAPVSGDTWLLCRLSLADYDKLTSLLAALDAGLPALERLSTIVAPPRAPVWEMAAQIAWWVAEDALRVLGKTAGKSPDSAAVQFTALAVQRMGFASATPIAISKRLVKFSKK
jgi:hypothetical protein